MLLENKELDIFVGSKIGSFKHVKYHTDTTKNTKKNTQNLQDIKCLQKGDEITSLRWADAEQTQIVVGRQNRTVQVFDTTIKEFIGKKTFVAESDKENPGEVVGAVKCGKSILTALSCGVVKLWTKKKSKEWSIDTGGQLDRMRQCPDEPTLIATGGQENELKVWKVGEQQAVFLAKNVAHDWLELRVPVWVSDVCFMPGTGGHEVATCSRHGFVRLYDTRTQRRPVCTVEFKNMAATCIVPAFSERMVVVGFGRGQMHQVDLRGKGKPDKGYKGSIGAVTDIAIHRDTQVLVSVSLDRHVKVHNANTKELLYKQYVTSKLSCLLVQTERVTPMTLNADERETVQEKDEEIQQGETEGDGESDKEYEEIFETMETIGDKKKRKQLEEAPETPNRKKKSKKQIQKVPQDEAGDEERTEEKLEEQPEQEQEVPDLDESIKQLLKSTEKKKKKMDKLKKDKKAKSVFHNA